MHPFGRALSCGVELNIGVVQARSARFDAQRRLTQWRSCLKLAATRPLSVDALRCRDCSGVFYCLRFTALNIALSRRPQRGEKIGATSQALGG